MRNAVWMVAQAAALLATLAEGDYELRLASSAQDVIATVRIHLERRIL